MNTRHDSYSDRELDELLAPIHGDVPPMSDQSFQSNRARVLAGVTAHSGSPTGAPSLGAARPAPPPAGNTPIPLRPRRFRRRLLAAAAAVAVLTGGALAVGMLDPFSTVPPASAAAVRTLHSASSFAIHNSDPAVGPGQYRYIETHAWWLSETMTAGSSGPKFAYLDEMKVSTWVPADQSQEWLERQVETGNRKWLIGSEAEARKAGEISDSNSRPGETRGRGGFKGQPANGSWQIPKQKFLNGLPRDPDTLFARLQHDTKGHGSDPNAEILIYAADALKTGLVPADIRAALFEALTKLPGLKVTGTMANLDGKPGIALGIENPDNGERQDLIFDKQTGQFIGEREVAGNNEGKIPAGTVTSFTSVTVGVADRLGVPPTR